MLGWHNLGGCGKDEEMWIVVDVGKVYSWKK